MNFLKNSVLKHFEAILILLITAGLVVTNFFIEQKIVFLNLYYLPVLISGYFLGKKQSIFTSIFIIGFVVFMVIYNGDSFAAQYTKLNLILSIIIWGGFLTLAAYTVGTLYEQKQLQLNDIKMAYIGIIEILAKYLEASDRYTKGHSVRVADFATEISIALQLPRGEVENIRVASLLHDIGKIEISSDLINKAATLTKDEKKIIDEHAEKGAQILGSLGGVLQGAIQIVLSHHRNFIEKTDKNGVPIPIGARILAVADSFDAMISDRPYRKGMNSWEALQELERCSGKQFDPQVVGAFKLVIRDKL